QSRQERHVEIAARCKRGILGERNSKVFKGKLESSSMIFQDIQLKTFEWVSRRSNKGRLTEISGPPDHNTTR
nr:squalene synthase [Tanacetum cinerariifolium]